MRPSDPLVRACLAPARRQLSVVIAFSVLNALLVVGQAFAVAALVLAAVNGEHVARAAWIVAGVLAARAACGAVVDLFAARAAVRVGTHLRRGVLQAVLRPGTTLSEGEAATLVTRGVTAAEPYLTRYLPALFLSAVLPPLTVVALATQDVMSALIVLATLPLIPVFGALVGLATRDQAAAQWRAMGSLSGHFVDVMRGLPTLVVFRRAQAQSAAIRTVSERYRAATMRTLRTAFASSAVLELVATLSVALVAVVVGLRLAEGRLDLGTALVVLLLAPEAFWPMRRAGAEFHAAAEGSATFERVGGLLAGHAAAVVDRRPGPLVVEDLTVTYPGRAHPAISGLTTTIPDRGLTVVVGPSGSGKSTLLAALMGLVGPAADPAWQAQVGWVPQRPTFLAGTIADNLRLAAPEATDAEMWAALTRVGLAEVVPTLQLPIGEDGRGLSAGERARLALARAVVADRPWLFLDEPTAHLDAVTERAVSQVLVHLARTVGVVVVAHRRALVDLADHVIELPEPVSAPPQPVRSGAGAAIRTELDQAQHRPRTGFVTSTVLGAAASASGVALTATAGWLIVKAAEHPPVLTMLVAIVGVRAFGLGRPVLRYAERLLAHDAALRRLAERRVEVYDTVVPLTPGRLGKRRGDLLASIVDDVESLVDRELRLRQPVWGFVAVMVLATGVAAMLWPPAALVLALAMSAAGAIAFGVSRAGGMRAERRAARARAQVAAQVVEAVRAAPELVMWQASPRVVATIERAGDELSRATEVAARSLAAARAVVLIVTGAAMGGVAVVAASASAAELSRPMLALIVLLPLALVDVVVPLAEAGGCVARIRAAEARLAEISGMEPAVTDPPHPQRVPDSHTVAGHDLTAGWDGPAFHGLGIDLTEGAKLGVVGPSGSGKSTLAAVLLRFIDPTQGQVALGGSPLPELSLDDVRRDIGLVDDDPHVFASTVVENVRLGRPGASDAEVEEVLRRVRLGPWLDNLEHGLHTSLGDGIADVSGGERARIGLARSLLSDQPVLVLDEPIAHLDNVTAELVAADLLDGAGERSVVWITHSEIGLDRMDTVLDLGRAM